MGSSLAAAVSALETTEGLVFTLRHAVERDDAIERLIRAIDDDRAALLATIIQGRALEQEPARLRRPVTG